MMLVDMHLEVLGRKHKDEQKCRKSRAKKTPQRIQRWRWIGDESEASTDVQLGKAFSETGKANGIRELCLVDE